MLPGFLEHLTQPGHRPEEKPQPREGSVTCLRSHRASGKAGLRAAARASPGTVCAAGSAGGCVCPAPAVEAVSWGLGTGGQVRPPRVLVGLIAGRDILREFSSRALGLWVQLWAPEDEAGEIPVACSSVTSALQRRCVRRVGARAQTQLSDPRFPLFKLKESALVLPDP